MHIKCCECAKSITHTVGSCPYCGCKKPFKGFKLLESDVCGWTPDETIAYANSGGRIGRIGKDGLSPGAKAALGFAGLVVFFVVLMYSEENKAPETRAAQTAEEKEREEKLKELAWVSKGKDTVLLKLKDPDSAEFRNTLFNRGEGNIPVACGQVNSKNSFGGFTGFQRFISAGTIDQTHLEEEVSGFGKLWEKLCL